MVKKEYVAVRQVREFIAKQPDECQTEYLAIVDRLEADGFLIEPFAKKISRNLFEIRIRRGRQVRVFYCYHEGGLVIGVHAFVKKAQKTPQREIKQALKIVAAIERGDYDE
jgi:phage-related protein